MAQGRRNVALLAATLFVVQESVVHIARWGVVMGDTLIAALSWAFLMGVAAAAGEAIHRTRLLEQMRQREIHRARQRELASDLHDTVAHPGNSRHDRMRRRSFS